MISSSNCKTNLNNIQIGRKIEHIRIESGLTNEAFSYKLGYAPQTVSKYINGKAKPHNNIKSSWAMLQRACEVFGFDIRDVVHNYYGKVPYNSERTKGERRE